MVEKTQLHPDLSMSKTGKAYTCGPCKEKIASNDARAIHRFRKYPLCMPCAKAYKKGSRKAGGTGAGSGSLESLERKLDCLLAVVARLAEDREVDVDDLYYQIEDIITLPEWVEEEEEEEQEQEDFTPPKKEPEPEQPRMSLAEMKALINAERSAKGLPPV